MFIVPISESENVRITTEELESKLMQLDNCCIALEELTNYVTLTESGDSSGAMTAYRNAYLILNQTQYSAESFGLDSSCLDMRVVTMENIGWEIFGKIFAIILTLVVGFLALFLKKKKDFTNQLTRAVIDSAKKLNFYTFGDIDSGSKLISELRKSLHLVESVNSILRKEGSYSMSLCKHSFEAANELFSKINTINSESDMDEIISSYSKKMDEYPKRDYVADFFNVSGLYVVSQYGNAFIKFSKGSSLSEKEINYLDDASIDKYNSRRNHLAQLDPEDVRGSDVFLKVKLKKSGGKYEISDSEKSEIYSITDNLHKDTDTLLDTTCKHLVDIRDYISRHQNLEIKLDKAPTNIDGDGFSHIRKISADLKNITQNVHTVLNDVAKIASVFQITIYDVT